MTSKKLTVRASHCWIDCCLLRNVLIVGQREDQACVLLHVQQQVVQVEHQQLYALLAVREGCMKIVTDMGSSIHIRISPQWSVCQHLPKLREQPEKVNSAIHAAWDQPWLLRRGLSLSIVLDTVGERQEWTIHFKLTCFTSCSYWCRSCL